jgi:hypothetical protein
VLSGVASERLGQTRHVSPEETVERLRRAQVGRLATARPDGTPHVVPFVFVVVDSADQLIVVRPDRSSAGPAPLLVSQTRCHSCGAGGVYRG